MNRLKEWYQSLEANQSAKRFGTRFYRWWNLPRGLGIAAIIVGLAYYINGPVPYLPYSGIVEFHRDIAPELIGIGLTVFLIDWAVGRNQDNQLREQLILQMGSRHNDVTDTAIKTLRARGWLKDGSLYGADLSKANLSKANLREVDLKAANLRGANLRGADLRGTDLRGALLHRAFLSLADLRGAKLSGANLSQAFLSKANLSGVNLSKAFLSQADLRATDLSRTNLYGANLYGANLSKADLYGADLRKALLFGANLGGAFLIQADLREADLTYADLRGTILSMTIMPDGIQIKGPDSPEGPTYVEWLAMQEGQVDEQTVVEMDDPMVDSREEE